MFEKQAHKLRVRLFKHLPEDTRDGALSVLNAPVVQGRPRKRRGAPRQEPPTVALAACTAENLLAGARFSKRHARKLLRRGYPQAGLAQERVALKLEHLAGELKPGQIVTEWVLKGRGKRKRAEWLLDLGRTVQGSRAQRRRALKGIVGNPNASGFPTPRGDNDGDED
jgi:hypothetical protein